MNKSYTEMIREEKLKAIEKLKPTKKEESLLKKKKDAKKKRVNE